MNSNHPNHHLETLEHFTNRIRYQYEPLNGLTVPASQIEKVNQDGSLAPYLGDTVIFELGDNTRSTIGQMQEALYARCGSLLGERLPVESFHITLHDLLSAPMERQDEILAGLDDRCASVNDLIAGFAEKYPDPIRVRPTRLFCMVGKSVVLGFEPADEDACNALMDMFSQLQKIVCLDYPFYTPHVTLAYFKPRLDEYGNPIPCDGHSVYCLSQAMQEISAQFPLDIVPLKIEDLHYCCFRDMSRYISKDEFDAVKK